MGRARALVAAVAAAVGVAGTWGCMEDPAVGGDECAQAKAVFTRCGVALPILEGAACTGMQRVVARCIARHATTCDDLSTLLGRIDVCAADELDGGDLPPLTDLPLPPPGDAAADSALDAPLDPVDAASTFDAAPFTDAAPDDARAAD
jgi:hypothetical protein